jgi:hypothetical protein
MGTDDRTRNPLGIDIGQPVRRAALDRFCHTLKEIEWADQKEEYEWRNRLVMDAVCQAQHLGFLAGYRIDTDEPSWPVAVIELLMPDGSEAQVSWHLPEHPRPWDGHDTEEKYRRLHAFTSAS